MIYAKNWLVVFDYWWGGEGRRMRVMYIVQVFIVPSRTIFGRKLVTEIMFGFYPQFFWTIL